MNQEMGPMFKIVIVYKISNINTKYVKTQSST